jgi:N-acetylglutamate synthase-like GNAT family acetyltransferase
VIRLCDNSEFDEINAIINDAAEAYRGVIPADRWHTPYMTVKELASEMDAGVVFSAEIEEGVIRGVMARQDVADVTLIRHAYVRTGEQGKGVGSRLIKDLQAGGSRPLLVGTWAAATWAISFYEKQEFILLDTEIKEKLLRTYWSVPKRQAETSVVLADKRWQGMRP